MLLKYKYVVVAIVLVLSLSIYSCAHNPIVPSTNITNLIGNPNFQVDGKPSLSGWVVGGDPYPSVVSIAPPNDGPFSLELLPGNPLEFPNRPLMP